MENAIEALKMAAAVLIFVLALSIGVNAFAEARLASQTILDYRDREFDTTYIDSATVEKNRTVGLETVVPSMYKSFDESYKVVFKGMDDGLYKKLNPETGEYIPVYKIYGNQGLGLSGKSQIDTFLKRILYGEGKLTNEEKTFIENLEKAKNIQFYDDDGLYFRLYNLTKETSAKEIIEKSGVFYKNEVEGATSSADKTKIRVITYELREI